MACCIILLMLYCIISYKDEQITRLVMKSWMKTPVISVMLRYYATDQRGGWALANLWRVTSDVTGSWTLRFAYDVAAQLGAFAGHGGFNDPDMLPLSAISG